MLLAGAGWSLAAIGLLLLADAQRRNAGSSLGALLRSPVGHALIWSGVAIGAAGGALLVALCVLRIRRLALAAAGIAALAAVIVHVANGHAGASRWPSGITVTVQAVHFAVAGVWIGGLAALLIGIRGAPSAEKAAAVRRFSIVAAAGLGVIVATGIARAISALRAWDELVTTGYGRAVLAKLALVGMIAAVAARNRRSGAPSAASDLAPLRRRSRVELALAAMALAVAALLGTLAPPLAGGAVGLPGLEASGTDVSGSVRVQLTALSNQPGPNRFAALVKDDRSGNPIQGASVRLLFTPLDDPGIASNSLSLTPAPGGAYVGSGPNMMFDGRWAVRVLIARWGGATEVPLELDPVGPPQRVTIERIAGQAPTYTKLVGAAGFVRISPHPERAGPSQLFVTFYATSTGDYEDVSRVVVTIAARHGGVRPAERSTCRARQLCQRRRPRARQQSDRRHRASPRRYAPAHRRRARPLAVPLPHLLPRHAGDAVRAGRHSTERQGAPRHQRQRDAGDSRSGSDGDGQRNVLRRRQRAGEAVLVGWARCTTTAAGTSRGASPPAPHRASSYTLRRPTRTARRDNWCSS